MILFVAGVQFYFRVIFMIRRNWNQKKEKCPLWAINKQNQKLFEHNLTKNSVDENRLKNEKFVYVIALSRMTNVRICALALFISLFIWKTQIDVFLKF